MTHPWNPTFGPFAAGPSDLSPRRIEKVGTIPVSPDEAFRLWTDARAVAGWLAPACNVDLHVGGPFEILFMSDAPSGLQGSEGCRFLCFVPGRMVAFTWNAPPSFGPLRDLYTFVVVDFAPTDSGTSVRITHSGWPASGLAEGEDSPWSRLYAYFDDAWGWVLRELTAHVAAATAG